MVLVHLGSKARIGEIVGTLRSTKNAYERAYDRTHNRGLRDLFGVLASSRITIINELEDALRSIPEVDHLENSTSDNRWDRVWRVVRNPSWLLGDAAVLNAIYRSEHRLLSMYDRGLLVQDLPESVADLLSRQRVQIAENVSNIALFLSGNLMLTDR